MGTIVSRARRISDGMFAAAGQLPHIDDLRSVSTTVAVAVSEVVEFVDIVQQVQDAMWQPQYRLVRAS